MLVFYGLPLHWATIHIKSLCESLNLSQGQLEIPINLSIVYFVILLLPGIVLTRYVNNIENLIKEKPSVPFIIAFSVPFIIAFMALLVICAFLLVFKAEKVAAQIANIAFFLLVTGVGIEVYRIIKYGEHDTGDDE